LGPEGAAAKERLQPGDLAGTIQILSTDAEVPELTVPVRGGVD
jgi:hypothetical protein